MTKKLKSIGIILIVLMIAAGMLVLTGCSKNPSLRGMEIVIGNWWGDYDVKTFEPQNEMEEKILAWRTKIQKDYGFTMKEKSIATWNNMQFVTLNSIMAGSPAASVFIMQPDWAMTMKGHDLLYPVSDNTVVDLRNPKPVAEGLMAPIWNQSTNDIFTFDGKIYAFSNDVNLQNAQVVFFNKRLFREAGIDPDLPYNMQKDGTWTWEEFIKLCKKLTRDVNNDGIIDTYALPQDLSTEILDAVLSSNGAMYVDRDPSTGKFVNATNRPEFMEALQYAIRLKNEGVMKSRSGEWDWYKAEFRNGNVAMRVDESWVWGELQRMKDDWGVVMFPKGPRSSTYRVFTRENIFVIPSTLKPQEVDRIMFAMQLWFTPVSDDWKSALYNTFRDARAVDETLPYIRDTSQHINKNHIFISGLERGHIAWEMWWHEGDPAQLVETVSQNWNALIQEANDVIFK